MIKISDAYVRRHQDDDDESWIRTVARPIAEMIAKKFYPGRQEEDFEELIHIAVISLWRARKRVRYDLAPAAWLSENARFAMKSEIEDGRGHIKEEHRRARLMSWADDERRGGRLPT